MLAWPWIDHLMSFDATSARPHLPTCKKMSQSYKACYDSGSEDSVHCFCTKFGQLILTEIIINCCHHRSDFEAKMHQNPIRLGLWPKLCWWAYSASPNPVAGFEGSASKGRGWEGSGREARRGKDGSVVECKKILKIDPANVLIAPMESTLMVSYLIFSHILWPCPDGRHTSTTLVNRGDVLSQHEIW